MLAHGLLTRRLHDFVARLRHEGLRVNGRPARLAQPTTPRKVMLKACLRHDPRDEVGSGPDRGERIRDKG
jgi:hypothetical protein